MIMKPVSIIIAFILLIAITATISVYSTLYIVNNLGQEKQNQNTEKEIQFEALQI